MTISKLDASSSPSAKTAATAADGTVSRPPLPPFDAVSAAIKVRKAEDAWNSRDPAVVSTAYTIDSVWRNRSRGLMRLRIASINDLAIDAKQRLFKWPLGPRPLEHKGLSELGL